MGWDGTVKQHLSQSCWGGTCRAVDPKLEAVGFRCRTEQREIYGRIWGQRIPVFTGACNFQSASQICDEKGLGSGWCRVCIQGLQIQSSKRRNVAIAVWKCVSLSSAFHKQISCWHIAFFSPKTCLQQKLCSVLHCLGSLTVKWLPEEFKCLFFSLVQGEKAFSASRGIFLSC